MWNEIINDQTTAIRDNMYVTLLDEGFEPGTAFDLSQNADFLELLVDA